MTAAEKYYHEIEDKIKDAKKSKMFGTLCMKAANGKAFVMFWKNFMVFKLPPDELESTLKLKGVIMFTPMEGRSMNGWAQVPFSLKAEWERLAKDAYDYVKKIKAM
ncbi:MAG TPA: hypothetical protein VKT28_11825 [Puia sp.]|nr:hypothetical protein [Puia sp.]